MKRLGCFAAIFLFLSVSAEATDLTLFGGFQNPGKITLREAPSQGISTAGQILDDPINVGMFGVRVGYGGVIGGETTFAYAPNFLDSSSKGYILDTNLNVQFPSPIVKPYATAGLATIYVKGTGPSDIGLRAGFNYGGGLKVFPYGPVGARLDVRGYAMPSIQDQTLNMVEVTLGVVFRLGD